MQISKLLLHSQMLQLGSIALNTLQSLQTARALSTVSSQAFRKLGHFVSMLHDMAHTCCSYSLNCEGGVTEDCIVRQLITSLPCSALSQLPLQQCGPQPWHAAVLLLVLSLIWIGQVLPILLARSAVAQCLLTNGLHFVQTRYLLFLAGFTGQRLCSLTVSRMASTVRAHWYKGERR